MLGMRIIVSLVFAAVFAAAQAGSPLMLTTGAWPDGGDIPVQYSPAAPNPVSPAFRWANPPAGTASFVFMLRDIDAVTTAPEDNIHWVIWNIPAAAFGLAGNMPTGDLLPSGSRQSGRNGPIYAGPDAPGDGPKRHFVFELYALDIKPEIGGSTASEICTNVAEAMEGHILGKAVWTGLFRRPN